MSQKVFVFVIVLLFTMIFTTAQEEHTSKFYYQMGDSTYFPDTPPTQQKEEKSPFSVAPYKFALHLGGGYAVSLLDVDFGKEGKVYGVEEVDILKNTVDDKYFPAFAGTVGLKIGMPEPFDKFAIGINVDYNVVSAEDLEVVAKGAAENQVFGEDIRVHYVSFMAFLEFRVPIELGKSFLAPYARLGIGLNVNFHDNRDVFDVHHTSLAIATTLGLEYYLSQKVSIFLEPKWHYNRADVRYCPNNTTEFEGKLELSTITCLVGINFYFGVGSSF